MALGISELVTCCTALLTVLSTVWSVSVEEGFVSTRPEPLLTAELKSEVGSGTHCTSGPADASADG